MKKSVKHFLMSAVLIILSASCNKKEEVVFDKIEPGFIVQETGFKVPESATDVLKHKDKPIVLYFDINPNQAEEVTEQLKRLKESNDLPFMLNSFLPEKDRAKFKNPVTILISQDEYKGINESLVISNSTEISGKYSVYYSYWND